jgi:AraC-like DNA-binding protein
MRSTPLISNLALHGLSDVVRGELGEKALLRANAAAGIDFEAIADRHVFIPQVSALKFMCSAARTAGELNFGLLLTPMMDVAHYGRWGDYLLGSETLGLAIERSIRTLGYHSTGDGMSLSADGDEARYSYAFALKGRAGYEHVACVGAAVLTSLCRFFTPTGWRPLRIELDIAKPHSTSPFEDLFQCPVSFDAPALTVVFDRRYLAATGPRRGSQPIVTIEDVARFTRGNAPRDLVDVLAEQVRIQVLNGSVSIDSAACAMDTSIRSLQRELSRLGTDFRTMANQARAGRATELLRHTDASVTDIAVELGYSAPASFARAFRNATGVSPREYRGLRQHA